MRLKGAPYDGPKTKEYAPTEPMIESIMCATCTSGSADLKEWTTGDVIVAAPPPELMASHGMFLSQCYSFVQHSSSHLVVANPNVSLELVSCMSIVSTVQPVHLELCLCAML